MTETPTPRILRTESLGESDVVYGATVLLWSDGSVTWQAPELPEVEAA